VTWNIPFTIHVKTAGVAMNRMMNIGINIGIQFNRKQNCDGFSGHAGSNGFLSIPHSTPRDEGVPA
jgi:hypothetical protein